LVQSSESSLSLASSHLGAANRFPDSVAADPDAARTLNADATASLAALTYSRGTFLIYISTDYVFAGRRGEAPYAATATPNPTNLYGATKLAGEQGVLSVPSATDAATSNSTTQTRPIPGVILRVPVLYGPVPPNDRSQSVLNTIVSQIWSNQHPTAAAAAAAPKVKMDDWAQRFPTNTQDVARVCADVAALYLREAAAGKTDLPRVLHFSGEERFTKWDMCQLFGEILALPVDGMVPDKPAEEGEGGAAGVQRPYDCHLDTSVLKELGIDVSAVPFETWWYGLFFSFPHLFFFSPFCLVLVPA
jgi:S-adenosylmethionine synthetase